MVTPNPRGYPTHDLPDAPEIPRCVPHWSWDLETKRRYAKARRALQRELRLAYMREILAEL